MDDEKVDGPVFLYSARLEPIGLFATHDSFEKLQDYASQYSAGEAKIASLFIGLTYNTCAAFMDAAMLGQMPAIHLDRILSLVSRLAGPEEG